MTTPTTLSANRLCCVRSCRDDLVTRGRQAPCAAIRSIWTRVRPGKKQGVLLSPFDPVLWDRKRVAQLFGFDQVLEIFKPGPQRKYGYFCLPVLAGERLVGRVDLKAQRKSGRLIVLSRHFEDGATSGFTQRVALALLGGVEAVAQVQIAPAVGGGHSLIHLHVQRPQPRDVRRLLASVKSIWI